MCGIMGYIGVRPARDIVFQGLKRLEYRGYDSVGIALMDKEGKLDLIKTTGNTDNIHLDSLSPTDTVGIGHTRWATHGIPSEANAHPHTVGVITLVHNGIIENYDDLKQQFNQTSWQSDTDSEVIAALVDKHYEKTHNFVASVQATIGELKGTFGLAIINTDRPGEVIVARRGSPIVIGVDSDEYYIASDPSAIIDHTDRVVYLEDDQVAVLRTDSLDVFDVKLNHQEVAIEQLAQTDLRSDKQHYESFLEKEIHEQPTVIQNTLRGRVSGDGSIVLGGPQLTLDEMIQLKQIVIIGCGTSYNAGYFAKYKLEEMLGIPVTVEHASEFRYRYGSYDAKHTLAIFLSQSGETADTLASLQEAKRRQMITMGIVNVVGSTLAREVDHGGVYLHAGVETSVASTKAFSATVTALLMFGGFVAQKRGLNSSIMHAVGAELRALPHEIEATLQLKPQVDKIADSLVAHHDWYFLGRNDLFPVALEGALKLMEVSYLHAQALPMGEMKHGPIAMVDDSLVSVILLPEDPLLYDKGLGALSEIKARNGIALTISTRPKPKQSDHHIQIAHTGQYTDGLVMNIVLQLLALEVATKRKLNIDQPRNLAKSVTVE